MCGIAGFIGSENRRAILAMISEMRHRGPDASGFHYDDEANLALGHCRLSIIDLSDMANQPMVTPDHRFSIVYNGEVYNANELRLELEKEGNVFRSRSDTEVVLLAWKTWGEPCLQRFRGMFAFAIWDASERRLILARDRIGIKPLYFAQMGDAFLFASELKGIQASGTLRPKLNRTAFFDYLRLGSVVQPHTVFEGVTSLMPGTLAILHEGRLQTREYWNLTERLLRAQRSFDGVTYEEACAGLRMKLEEATRYHLVSDVALGAFLSGGIDSTSIVGLMGREVRSPIRTFSLGFEDSAEEDERRWARLAANQFGCDHSEATINGAQVEECFDEIICSLDQPSVDGINTFLISREASGSVRVALSGLGGDELFGGYPHFHYLHWQDAGNFSWLKQKVARVAARVHGLPSIWSIQARINSETGFRRYLAARRLREDCEIISIVTAHFSRSSEEYLSESALVPFPTRQLDDIQVTSLLEIQNYLRDTLLRDCDAMSMAHSLEVRPVFLDHPLVEYALSMPGCFKVNGCMGKRILVDACKDLLPPSIQRRQKVGFSLPLLHWLRGPLLNRAEKAFSSNMGRELFNSDYLDYCLQSVRSRGKIDYATWSTFVLISFAQASGLNI